MAFGVGNTELVFIRHLIVTKLEKSETALIFGDYEMTFKQAFLTSAIITYMLVVLLLLLRIDSK